MTVVGSRVAGAQWRLGATVGPVLRGRLKAGRWSAEKHRRFHGPSWRGQQSNALVGNLGTGGVEEVMVRWVET